MPVPPPLTLIDRPAGRIRPQLENLRQVLSERGNPQLDFPSILIVGTNGKGSTAALLEAMLRAHELTTGLFTSPHLVRVEERIRIGGLPVDSQVLERHLRVFDADPDLTYFETLTAAAFTVFSEAEIDVAVLEAGMGGSWDATRLAASSIAGLTNIGSDHAAWLGNEPAAVAREKGRALAAADRAVVGSGVDEALLPELGAPRAQRARSVVSCFDHGDGRVAARWNGRETRVHLPLAGAFQLENLELALALALAATEAGLIPVLEPRSFRAAVESVNWPGRLSSHRVGGREVVLDCAHNLEAARALADHLGGLERRHNLLFSCLDDKPVEAMAEVLAPHVGDIAVCPLDDDRAMPVERIAAAFPGAEVAEDPRSALDRLCDPVVAAGSIRLVGALFALSEDAR